MSIPLLLERKTPGMGPKIPLRVSFARIVVEGLISPDRVWLHSDGFAITMLDKNGEYELENPLSPGAVAQAELSGEAGSCVSVRLEIQ